MKQRRILAVVGTATILVGAAVALPVTSANSAVAPSTSVAAQANGGYITTYTASNGDVFKVFAATPVKISPAATTASTLSVDGSQVTEHMGGISVQPATVMSKTQLTSALADVKPMTAHDELLALGANPADITSFQDMPSTAAIATRSSPNSPGKMSPYSNTGGGTQVSNPPYCVSGTFDGSHGSAYGCDVTRRVGTNGSIWYLTDALESSGTMHDTGCTLCDHLTGLKFGNTYGSGNIIQDWKPRTSAPVGSCHTVTESLTYQGIGVSDTSTQCPATFGLYSVSYTSYSTKWDGQGNGPNDGSRGTNAVDSVYNCASCNYLPTASISWWYTTT